MGAGLPPLPAGFKPDPESSSGLPPLPTGFIESPSETRSTTPPAGGTAPKINLVSVKDAFPGKTLEMNLVRRQPELLPKWLSDKGYRPLPDEQNVGDQQLYAGPGGKVIDANEFLPATGMVIHGPPVALQTGAAMTSAFTGPLAPGAEAALGAGASVGGDLYDAMLNKAFGLPSGLSAGGEARSAFEGALAQSAPSAFEVATGTTAARRAATSAMDIASKEAEDLAAKKAAIKTEQDVKIKTIGKKLGSDDATASIRDQVQADRNKLAKQVGKGMEDAREPVAQQVGKQSTEKMLGKTPEQLSAERAQTIGPIAERRAAAQSPYFDAAHALHEEVGKKFDPYINPVKNNPIDQIHADGLTAQIDQIEQWGMQNGQRVEDPTLNRIFDRIKESGEMPDKIPDPFAPGKYLNPKDRKQMAMIKQFMAENPDYKMPGTGSKPLTYGELWGYRAQANKVLATSRNPGARYAAHQLVDAITEMMPNVPQALKNEYATERTWFGASLTGKVANSAGTQQVGEAIWGAPVEVQQELIRRATTPEAKEGLKLSFVDNFLGNKMKPDDLAKFDPKVVRSLFGSDGDAVLKLLGPEGKVKSASWEALIQHDPRARQAFDDAAKQVLEQDDVVATRKAIADGQSLLREWPDEQVAKRIQAHVDTAKLPADKLRILQTEMPDPRKAGIEAVGKLKAGRIESIMQRYGAFSSLALASGGRKYLLTHPVGLIALGTGGTLLGGRAVLRYALTKPGVAGAFVDMLSNPANYRNAQILGRGVAALLEGSMLQAVKTQGIDQSFIAGSVPQNPTQPDPTP